MPDNDLTFATQQLIQLKQSHGWDLLQRHAAQEIETARDELETVDPKDAVRIASLQNLIGVWRRLGNVLDELILQGVQLEEFQGIANAAGESTAGEDGADAGTD